jgi:hypothetical protein
MSNLVYEFLLRLIKPLIALFLAALVYWVATGFAGATGSVELALLCWLSGTAFVLLVQESII